jgi:hypothetical protein
MSASRMTQIACQPARFEAQIAADALRRTVFAWAA